MKALSLALVSLFASLPLHAAIVGIDDFSYSNGPINNLSGGTGWNRVGGVSAWGSAGSLVSGGQLITDANVGAFREYGGDEFNSAQQGGGVLFFKFTMSFGATLPNYAGLSSFDFGTEKIFFGRTFQGNLGIDESTVGTTTTSIAPTANTSYTMVGVLDFDKDVLSLFVNPDGADIYNTAAPTGAGNTADAIRTGFTSGNWSSQIRLQSGDQGSGVAPTSWDNVTVATTPGDVGLAVPEPGGAVVLALSGLALLFLRRRR